ncbi:MAG: hypothetical protein FJ029_04200 [Actinobacteria bacterium]|nr:hypothetical protein [Actinomycetota bacterium]
MIPIKVYQKEDAAGSAWAAATDISGTAFATSYLTLTNGFVSYLVNGGGATTKDYYGVTIGTGGNFYTVATTSDSTHSLSPQFLVTVTSAG